MSDATSLSKGSKKPFTYSRRKGDAGPRPGVSVRVEIKVLNRAVKRNLQRSGVFHVSTYGK